MAKRSIIGTRVCAPGEDGKYYSGVIQAVKTPATFAENTNCINLTPHTRYTVKFDLKSAVPPKGYREYRECDLIGPGFRSISGVQLLNGQRVYITFNGREVSGEVVVHQQTTDEVVISALPPGHEVNDIYFFTFSKFISVVKVVVRFAVIYAAIKFKNGTRNVFCYFSKSVLNLN